MSTRRTVVRLLVVALLVFAVLAPTAALANDGKAIGLGLACDGVFWNPADPTHNEVPDASGIQLFYENFGPNGTPNDGDEELVAFLDLSDATEGQVVFVNFVPGDPNFPDWNGAVEIIGSAFDDLICLGTGSSLVLAGDGDDTVFAEWEDTNLTGPLNVVGDVVFGGDGDDFISGQFSPLDTIHAGALDVNPGWFIGGDGNDIIVGTDADPGACDGDVIFGGNGDDELWGMLGSDQIRGNRGMDVIYGNMPPPAAADEVLVNCGLFGGPDDDFVMGGEAGEGVTAATGVGPAGATNDDPMLAVVVPDLTPAAHATFNFILGVTGYSGIFGNAGDDTLMGSPLDAALGFPDVSDVINGGPGDDFIEGYGGNDLLLGATGGDTIFGYSAAAYGDGIGDELGGDTAGGAGVGQQQIEGGKGFDFLWGGSMDDFILGQANQDVLGGDMGVDLLGGGAAADVIFGDAGAEGTGNADDIQGDRGRDLVYQDDGSTNLADGGWIAGLRGADELHGDDGNDTIFGDDTIPGFCFLGLIGDGADLLFGHDGDDDLDGGMGDDVLRGGDGDDILCGDFGADMLYGGGDDDFLAATTSDGTVHPAAHPARAPGGFTGAAGDLLAVDDMFGGFGNDVAESICAEPDSFTEFDGQSTGVGNLGDVSSQVQFEFGEVELTDPLC